jgi:Trk K+ transport system NAD-binding subunit
LRVFFVCDILLAQDKSILFFGSVRVLTMKQEREKQKILLFGLSYFGRALLKELSKDWKCVAVDVDEERLGRSRENIPAVEYHAGAADSLVTWKKLQPESIKYIISTLKDTDINLEVCRIAREELKLRIPLIILDYGDKGDAEALFEPFRATLVNRLHPSVQSVLKKLEKNVIHAVNVGLEKGELLEVAIRARSHLVGRKLKYLRPSRWHISALYRNNELILPGGNCTLKVGDRVVLVGNPRVLEEVTAILLKGEPQFPLQYGSEIMFPLHMDYEPNMEEANLWFNASNALRIQFIPFKKKLSASITNRIEEKVKKQEKIKNFELGPTIELFRELFNLEVYNNTGILMVPVDKGFLSSSRIKDCFKRSRKPFLLSRMTYCKSGDTGCCYEGVVILLNGPDPGQAMLTGIEVARLLNIDFRVLYATLPKEMRGMEDNKRLQLRRQIVSDFEGIHKETIDYTVLEGNPVRELLKHLAPLTNHLVVMVNNPVASMSFFKPYVPYLVAKQSTQSALVIPEAETDE